MEIPPCKNIIEEVTNLSELTSRQLGLFGIGLVVFRKNLFILDRAVKGIGSDGLNISL